MKLKEESSLFEKHLFICTKCSYALPDGSCSNPEVAVKMRAKVKALCKSRFPNEKIRVNSSGCLGQCENGIASVIYPEGKWLTALREGDEEIILTNIKSS